MTFNPSLDRSHPKHAVVRYFEHPSRISKPQSHSENFCEVDEVHISGIVCLQVLFHNRATLSALCPPVLHSTVAFRVHC